MLFCPCCGNCLLVDSKSMGVNFFCKTCSYLFRVTQKVSKSLIFSKKKIDDIMGSAQDWADVDQIQSLCPKCSHTKAYFRTAQIRSADEPATQFYRCVNCSASWSQNQPKLKWKATITYRS